jgi:citrate/tricarballylate utilization protein
MRHLEAMAQEAIALANGEANAAPLSMAAEAARQMQICNACRYCEGFCAVFPAMTRRLEFTAADMHYLANLCHNCGACLHACQYAPPHEFAVNVPQAMAKLRGETYTEYAWPHALGALYRRNGLVFAVAATLGIAVFLWLALFVIGGTPDVTSGNFYDVFPHNTLVAIFGAAFGWAVIALGVGATRFWKGQEPGPAEPGARAETLRNVLALTYLDGGHGDGCNEESDRFTLARRRFHHLTFYGFLLCFASTSVATIYHYAFGLHAPYAFVSLPVLLGTLGGIGLLAGPAGLLWLNLRRDPQHGDVRQRPMDRAFIALLFATSVTGLALLAWRATPAMPTLLAVHLGAVIALFLTLPYGKFAHAVYRTAALLKWNIEKRQPNKLQIGAE